MRRLTSMALFLLPLAAYADHSDGRRGHRHDAEDRRGAAGQDDPDSIDDHACEHHELEGESFLLVENPNKAPVDIVVGGRLAGRAVPGHSRLGPFARGEVIVEAQWSGAAGPTIPLGKERVRFSSGRVGRFQVTMAREALIHMESRWVEPMRVRIAGRDAGLLPAGGQLEALLPFAGAEVKVLGPRGEVAMSRTASARALESVGLTLCPPRDARVLVENPAPRPLEIRLAHRGSIASIAPFSREEIVVPSGNVELVAFLDGRVIDEDHLVASPWRTNTMLVEPPSTAQLSVMNPYGEVLQVYADGRFLGVVAPWASVTFATRAGAQLDLVARTGRRNHVIAEATLYADPWVVTAWSPMARRWDGRRHRDHAVSWDHHRGAHRR
jgi:hypothetical protein